MLHYFKIQPPLNIYIFFSFAYSFIFFLRLIVNYSRRTPFFFRSKLVMVRPRASDTNLSIAVAFGQLFVVRAEHKDLKLSQNSSIPCHGPRSLYALFAACYPNLSRGAQDKQPKNRFGVTMVEFNKALNSSGFQLVNIDVYFWLEKTRGD